VAPLPSPPFSAPLGRELGTPDAIKRNRLSTPTFMANVGDNALTRPGHVGILSCSLTGDSHGFHARLSRRSAARTGDPYPEAHREAARGLSESVGAAMALTYYLDSRFAARALATNCNARTLPLANRFTRCELRFPSRCGIGVTSESVRKVIR
jgi:hypothetical protein